MSQDWFVGTSDSMLWRQRSAVSLRILCSQTGCSSVTNFAGLRQSLLLGSQFRASHLTNYSSDTLSDFAAVFEAEAQPAAAINRADCQ